MDAMSLPIKFIDEYLPKADPVYVVVYLYAYRFLSQGMGVPEVVEVAQSLGIKVRDVEDAVSYWARLGFNLGSKNAVKTLHKSIYTPTEISRTTENDKKLKWLFDEVQTVLGKFLSSSDMQTIFWIYDYLGLGPQVIMMIISYAKKHDKTNMRYIEKMAFDWAEHGVDTVRKAERHLAKLDESQSYEYHIKKLFGVKDRDFTPSEKAAIEAWRTTLSPSDELLLAAFDINISRNGKLSVKYIYGILKSWAEKGINTADQIAMDTKPAGRTVKRSNFEQREDIDFEARELEILKKRLKQS